MSEILKALSTRVMVNKDEVSHQIKGKIQRITPNMVWNAVMLEGKMHGSSGHHLQEPLLVSTRVEIVEPLDRGFGGCACNGFVVFFARHQAHDGILPEVDVLLRDDIVAILVLLAGNDVDREAIRKVNLGLLESAGIGSDNGDSAKLGLSDDDAPRLEPDRRCNQNLDAIPNLVGVACGRHDPSIGVKGKNWVEIRIKGVWTYVMLGSDLI